MFSYIFLFLQASYSKLPVDGKCTCFFDINENKTVCYSDCQQELVEPDRLYRCPSKQFQQRLPFWNWILAEIFCIKKDNRKDVVENYQPSSTVNYDTPNASVLIESSSIPTSQAQNELTYGSSIFISNLETQMSSPFSYPFVSISSSICGKMKKAQFMIPSSSTCYYEQDSPSKQIVEDFISLLHNESFVISPSNIRFEINLPDEDNYTSSKYTGDSTRTNDYLDDSQAILLDTFISSIDIQFYVDGTSITNSIVSIQRMRLNDQSYFPLTVTINYITQNQYQSRIIQKSGNFGYSIGQPVIVLQKGSLQEEPFPVPYGCTGNDSYTPLLFGVDTISGFKDDKLSFLNNDFQISKLGQGNPKYKNDWIDVNVKQNPEHGIKIYTLKIYYSHIGNVDNPQNMIISANLLTPEVKLTQYILKCTFFKLSNNPSHQYLPPNPRPPGIPRDTFYPFSNDEI